MMMGWLFGSQTWEMTVKDKFKLWAEEDIFLISMVSDTTSWIMARNYYHLLEDKMYDKCLNAAIVKCCENFLNHIQRISIRGL
jgi:hypothetical protein